MKARLIVSTMFFTFLFSSTYGLEPSYSTSLNVKTIESYLGKKGHSQPDENLYRILIPRDDLEIAINGMKVTTDMGLTSRLEFRKADEDDEANLSGDLILSQDQVNPVMTVVLNQGLEVTDLHNPFLWDSPRVMVMHIHGTGSEAKLAKGLNKILFAMKATMHGQGDFPLVSLGETETDLNVMSINTILGARGVINSGAYKILFSNPKSDVGRAVAKNSWASFSGSNSETLLDGTVAVKAAELQMVLRALRNSQIYVLAIYQHVIDDDPNFVFVHYWGVGDSRKLARALRVTMLTAENHVEKNDTFLAEKHSKAYPFLPEPVCNNQKPLALTDSDFKKPTPELHPVKATNIFEMMKSGMEKALVKTEAKANYFLVNTAANWLNGQVKPKTQAVVSKIELPHDVVTKAFYNSGLIEKHVLNSLLWTPANKKQVSHIFEKNYNYISQLINNHPIVFNEPKQAIEKHAAISLYKEEVNNLLHKVFSKKEIYQYDFGIKYPPKNFNYFTQLKNAAELPVLKFQPISQPVMVKITQVRPTVTVINDFKNTMQILQAIKIVLGVKSTPENNLQLHQPKKQYNYVAQLQRFNPVTFSNEAVQTRVSTVAPRKVMTHIADIASSSVKPINNLSSQPNDFHNDVRMNELLANQLGMKWKAAQNNLNLHPANKKYDYAIQVQKANPVIFSNQTTTVKTTLDVRNVKVAVQSTLPAVQKTRVIPSQPKDFHNVAKLENILVGTLGIKPARLNSLVLHAENKNFSYLAQIQRTNPVIFPKEPAPKPIIAVDFHNNAKLTNALSSKLGIKQDTQNSLVLHAENKNYNYINKIQTSHPVNFPKDVPQPVKSELAAAAKSAHDFHNEVKLSAAVSRTLGIRQSAERNCNLSENINYDYVRQLQKRHPVIFMQETVANPLPKPLAMNSFHNDDKLTKAVLSAFRSKQDKPEPTILGQINRSVAQNDYHAFLLAENTRSTLPAPISEMATTVKSDAFPAIPGNIIPIKAPVTKASILKSYPEVVIVSEKIKPIIPSHRVMKIAAVQNKPVVLADAFSQDITKELNAKINKPVSIKKVAQASELVKALAIRKGPTKKYASKSVSTVHQILANNVRANALTQNIRLEKKKPTQRMALQKRLSVRHLALKKEKSTHRIALQKQKPITHLALQKQKPTHRIALLKPKPMNHIALQKYKPIHHIALQRQKIIKHTDPIHMMAKQESKPLIPSHVKMEENPMPFDGISE